MPDKFPYLKPPKLVRGKWKWMIVWEEAVPGQSEPKRIRKTFDLNRACFVANPELREVRAKEILAQKRKDFALGGAPPKSPAGELGNTQIYEAIHVALKVKCATDREHTRITYTSFTNIFCEYLRAVGWLEIPVCAFDRAKAKAFLDWVLLERKTRDGQAITGKTYNNYLINLRALFYELKDRKYIADNPFANHPKRKEEQKKRHAFIQEDSNLIADYVYKHHRQIYLAILLISHCGLRLSELRRLRARDVDLERGMIVLGGDQTKNRERAFITIPSVALDTLRSFEIDKVRPGYLLFGRDLQPHPKEAVGRNTISDRFREMLREMVKKGLLGSMEGYTAYSWKDTGALAMVRSGMDILAIQKHLRHKSLDTTQRYLQSLGIINQEVRDFRGIIFRLPHEFVSAA